MPFELLLNEAPRVLMARFTGTATNHDVQTMSLAARRYVEKAGACPAIADFSPVDGFAVTIEFIRGFARAAPIMAGHRRVLVGPTDQVFGSLRMFEMHQSPDGTDVEVVRSLEQAYALLLVRNPDFRPITV
jgi:hypothetical protein